MAEVVVAHRTSTEKSFCIWEKLKIINHAQLFYLRNSKKALVTLISKFFLKKNTAWVKVAGFKNETVRAFRAFTLLSLHQGLALDSPGRWSLHHPCTLSWILHSYACGLWQLVVSVRNSDAQVFFISTTETFSLWQVLYYSYGWLLKRR